MARIRTRHIAMLASALLVLQLTAAEALAARKKPPQTKRQVAGKPVSNVRAKKLPPPMAAAGDRRGPGLYSSSALVLDQRNGEVLYEKNAAAVVPIASITKLMTAMVTLDATPDLGQGIVITQDDVDTQRHSRSRLAVGSVVSREEALLLALMSSENRAAHALSRNFSGGTEAFVMAMNQKAASLGMTDTRFEDPTGLSSNNVSSARDLAKMVEAAHSYPLIREFSTTTEAAVPVRGRRLEFHNTNRLVNNASWDIGLSKTGYIHEAGKCLVMQARVEGVPTIIVLLDSAGKLTRIGDANRVKRWMENGGFAARSGSDA